LEQRVLRKQARYVSVLTYSQHNAGKPSTIPTQLSSIRTASVIRLALIRLKRMELRRLYRCTRDELLKKESIQSAIVALFIIQRHKALIYHEKLHAL
jgi:hypothetical protein